MAEYTTIQVAMLTERSERTVQRWLHEGVLKARHIKGNRYDIAHSDLEPFLPRKVSENLAEKIEALKMNLEALGLKFEALASTKHR